MSVSPPPPEVLAGAQALEALARAGGIGSPFQSAGWLAGWFEGHGGRENLRLVRLEVGGGQWLLPVALERRAGCRIARKIGDGHASFYTPLRLGAPTPLERTSLRRAALALAADALILTDCPACWDGHAPFAPGFAAAPDIGRGLALPEGPLPAPSGSAAKKLRAKRRALESLGVAHAGFVEGAAAHHALAEMLRWKEEQLGRRGIVDPFAGPQMEAFLAAGLSSGALRVFVLGQPHPAAAMLVAQAGAFASGMTIAYDPAPEIARASPGDVLLGYLVEALAQEGLRWFDLGVGDMRYKRAHCPVEMPLVDVIVPATLRGAAYAAAFGALRATKRAIKSNARLLALLERGRAGLRGRQSGLRSE